MAFFGDAAASRARGFFAHTPLPLLTQKAATALGCTLVRELATLQLVDLREHVILSLPYRSIEVAQLFSQFVSLCI